MDGMGAIQPSFYHPLRDLIVEMFDGETLDQKTKWGHAVDHKIIKRGTYKYPKVLESLALELAEIRSKLSANAHSNDTEEILGELVARSYLSDKDIEYNNSPLIEMRPVAKPDLYIGKESIDIKTLRKDSDMFMVNYSAHNNKEKRPDYYWLVRLDGDFMSSHFAVKSKDVDNWKVKKTKVTKVYFANLNDCL